MFFEYDYDVLAKQALRFDATQEEIDDLGRWFEEYGMRYWNGECFEIDATHSLYPVYSTHPEDDYEFIGWEIR